jgi:hypothetical protein
MWGAYFAWSRRESLQHLLQRGLTFGALGSGVERIRGRLRNRRSQVRILTGAFAFPVVRAIKPAVERTEVATPVATEQH